MIKDGPVMLSQVMTYDRHGLHCAANNGMPGTSMHSYSAEKDCHVGNMTVWERTQGSTGMRACVAHTPFAERSCHKDCMHAHSLASPWPWPMPGMNASSTPQTAQAPPSKHSCNQLMQTPGYCTVSGGSQAQQQSLVVPIAMALKPPGKPSLSFS